MSDKAKKLPQIIAALAATFGAFGLGLGLSWTSPALPVIADCTKTDSCRLSEDLGSEVGSWIGSLFAIGALISSFGTGFLMAKIGRKWTMIVMAVPFIIGWILLTVPIPQDITNPWIFYMGRILTGIGGGSFSLASPIYISEISESSIRGALGSLMQFQLTVGVLFNNGLGAVLDLEVLTGICIVFPVILAVMMFFMPESPYYLLLKGKDEEARKALQWLRGKDYNVEPELEEMRKTQKEQEEMGSVSLKELFTQAEYVKPTLIMLALMFFQQFSGINAVLFYLTDIFIKANTGIDEGLSATLVSLVQMIATLLAVLIVEKLGRKILLTISAILMAISIFALGTYFYLDENKTELCFVPLDPTIAPIEGTTIETGTAPTLEPVECEINLDGFDPELVTSIAWLPLLSIIVYIIAFSIGFGPLPWMMNGEFFSLEAKGIASTLATAMNWLCAFLVSKFSTNIDAAIETSGSYFLYGSICVVSAIFVLVFIPETRGKSPDQMKRYFQGVKSGD